MYSNVSCPKCGSTDVESKSTMMERNFTMCYVQYCECRRCGNIWEPKKSIDLPVGDGKYLKVPDGATLIVIFPDGEEWRKKLRYLDSHHFDLNGGIAWHVGQFRELVEENPGIKVTYAESTDMRASNDCKTRATPKRVPITKKSTKRKVR